MECLSQRHPDAQLLGLDLAEGMLQFARSQRTARANWLCADAEALPLAPASVDLVYSSLSIQWCEQLGTLFKELQRVLCLEELWPLPPWGPAHCGSLSRRGAAWMI